MARASIPTLLSLDRWAALMGIPPVGFNSGIAPLAFPLGGACSEIWWQYNWQAHDRVSREDMARAIGQAEAEIARAVGYWPAPVYVTGDREMHPVPKFHQRDVLTTSWNSAGRDKSVPTAWGRIVSPGRRQATLVGAVAPVYSDADTDGFSETATVTIATTITDIREIRFYHPGHAAAPEWEIRPARTIVATGAAVTATFWAWHLVLPALWEAFPGPDGDMTAVDVSVATNLEATVNVYRVYADAAQAAARFEWEPDLSAAPSTVALTVQNGTFLTRDADGGIVVPYPATCTGGVWTSAAWTNCIEADRVRLWYLAGDRSDGYLAAADADPLSEWWAQAIAWMATARLDRPFCACGGVQALANWLRTDLALQSETSYATTEEILSCPFGTRVGEVKAWQRCAKFGEGLIKGATI